MTNQLNGASLAQALFPTATPEDENISSKHLLNIRPFLENYVHQGLIPGAVCLIARRGRVVHTEAVGKKDIESRRPAAMDTIYRIASMTKPITSVAAMMLFDEGHFALSDPVMKWIPEFSEPKVALRIPDRAHPGGRRKTVLANQPVTIQHLLTHTSGLPGVFHPDVLSKDPLAKTSYKTVGDFVKHYARLPLRFHPGEAWEYSRATCVLGYLVEIISGMTLADFFYKRIFQPLAMPDTHFFLPAGKLSRFAAAYAPGKDLTLHLIDPPTKESAFVRGPHLFFMGSGGLVSTLSDYFRFNLMMLNGGELDGVRLLRRETVNLMTRSHTGQLPVNLAGPSMGFGLGYAIEKDTADSKVPKGISSKDTYPWCGGTYTWGGAFCTHQWVDPVKKLIGILMTQVRPYSHLNVFEEFVRLTYECVMD